MREGKSRNTVFFQWFVALEGRKVGSLKRRVRSHLAKWEMKKCTPLVLHLSYSVPYSILPFNVAWWPWICSKYVNRRAQDFFGRRFYWQLEGCNPSTPNCLRIILTCVCWGWRVPSKMYALYDKHQPSICRPAPSIIINMEFSSIRLKHIV